MHCNHIASFGAYLAPDSVQLFYALQESSSTLGCNMHPALLHTCLQVLSSVYVSCHDSCLLVGLLGKLFGVWNRKILACISMLTA